MGVRIRGTLGDIDPLNKVPFKRAISRVKKGSPEYYLGLNPEPRYLQAPWLALESAELGQARAAWLLVASLARAQDHGFGIQGLSFFFFHGFGLRV